MVEVSVQSEAAFELAEQSKEFYITYDWDDDKKRALYNLRKVLTIYCHPKDRNVMCVHLLRAFSKRPPTKYLTSGTQQRFVPMPGACIILCLRSNHSQCI